MRGMVSPRPGGPGAGKPKFFLFIAVTFIGLAVFFVLYETWALTHAINVVNMRQLDKVINQGDPKHKAHIPGFMLDPKDRMKEGSGAGPQVGGGDHNGHDENVKRRQQDHHDAAAREHGLAEESPEEIQLKKEVQEKVKALRNHQNERGLRHEETTAAPALEEETEKLEKHETTQAPTPPQELKTNLDKERRDEVVKAIKHSWSGYKKHAWGLDEYHPIAKNGMNWAESKSGLGLTIIDALDTLIIAGLKEEADQALEWIETKLTYDQPVKVSMFETTIRAVGGLISGYELTGRKKLLDLAVELQDRMMPAFDTPSGVPDNYIHLKTKHHEGAGWNSGFAILSEFGSLQLELKSLTYLTGNKNYARKGDRALQAIKSSCQKTGFCNRNYAGPQGQGATAGLGSFGDSFYEYLLKQYILSGRKDEQWKVWWLNAAEHIIKTSNFKNEHFVPNGEETGESMEHLACFSGGLFALSYHVTGHAQHLDVAERIAATCHFMYVQSPMGLGPDSAQFMSGGRNMNIGEAKYILRPETVESYFYLWKITKQQKYRDWGFAVLEACNKHLKVDGGYVGTHSTRDNERTPASTNDNQETFWLAETLKYLYMLFSEDGLIDLDKVVFNTEAHRLKVIPDLNF